MTSTIHKPAPTSQNGKILAALSSGTWRTVAAIHREAGFSRLNSRVSELRSYGYRIEHRTNPGAPNDRGSLRHSYRWLDAPGILPDTGQLKIPQPRTSEERFRIYCVNGAERTLMATCPDEESVGVAICTMGREGAFNQNGCSLGILDTHGVEPTVKPGTWLVNPWTAKVV